MAGRLPDYRVAMMNKKTEEKNGSVGGAWINEDGTISIILDGFIRIDSTKDLLMTLFPRKERA
jgi:hypothetical protein